jgi:formamidopyrimidine-DNA glycosylase
VPELPDITVYLEALEPRILGRTLDRVRINGPFLLRTASPPLDSVFGLPVVGLRRIGKRIALGCEGGLWLVLHLMIAGRLHWRKPGVALVARNHLAAFDFAAGSLLLTEAGTRKRASLHVTRDPDALDPGGVEVLTASETEFRAALTRTNHTLKRALTDPRICSGIGNAYSDEILHRARLSPLQQTRKMTAEQIAALHAAAREVLAEWIARLRHAAGGRFPEGVTAFRPEMAAHGKHNQPCPRCGTKIQRIRYATTETNYCPACQTGGKLLADRGLSRLLREDWPRTLDQLEQLKPGSKSATEAPGSHL